MMKFCYTDTEINNSMLGESQIKVHPITKESLQKLDDIKIVEDINKCKENLSSLDKSESIKFD